MNLRSFVLAACVFALPISAAGPPQKSGAQTATAVFAGGCFWCMEPPFEKLAGVQSVVSGYTGGTKETATYEQVSNRDTAHFESVEVRYDPRKITYAKLLEVYWRNIDPTDRGGQFCDVGSQYRSAIFFRNAAERDLALAGKARIEKEKRIRVATLILPAAPFYKAEEYHQDYYKKNPVRYRFYRYNCGRDDRLEEVWGSSGH